MIRIRASHLFLDMGRYDIESARFSREDTPTDIQAGLYSFTIAIASCDLGHEVSLTGLTSEKRHRRNARAE